MKNAFLALITIAISFLWAYGASAEGPPSTIRVGALLDLSGEYAMAGGGFREGIDLAVEEINRSGGINGSLLEVVYEDTHYNMRNVATAANKFLAVDKVSVGLVATFTEAMIAGPLFEKSKVPLITLWDSAPEIEAIGDYVFGIGVWAPSTSSVAAQFARQELNAESAVTISTNGEWSLGVSEVFRKQFAERGGKILGHFEVNPTDTDFRTILTRAKTLNPDVFYAPVSDNVPAFWMQLTKLGIKKPAITSDVLNQEILKTIGKSAEGVYQTQAADPSQDETRKVMEAYKKKYGRECTQSFITSLGYDAIALLARAMNSHNASAEGIREGLKAIRNYAGAVGETTIDRNGSARRIVSIFQVRQQTLQLVKKAT